MAARGYNKDVHNIGDRNSQTQEPASDLAQMVTTQVYEGGFRIVLQKEYDAELESSEVHYKLGCPQTTFYNWCFTFANDDIFNVLQKTLSEHQTLLLIGRKYPPVIQWKKGFHSSEKEVCHAFTEQLHAHTKNVACLTFKETFIDVEKFKHFLSKNQKILNRQVVVYKDTEYYFITGYEHDVNEILPTLISLESAASPDGSISVTVDGKQKPGAGKSIDDRTQKAPDISNQMAMKGQEETPKFIPGQKMPQTAGNNKTTVSQAHLNSETCFQAAQTANTETDSVKLAFCDLLGVTSRSSSMVCDDNESQAASHLGSELTEHGLESVCFKSLNPLQIELYHRFCLNDEIYEGISVSLQGNNLCLKGNPPNVTSLMNRITSKLDSLEKTKQIINNTSVSQVLLEMMQSSDVLSHVSNSLRKKGLICYLQIVHNYGICIEVYTTAERSTVVNSMLSCFFHCEMAIDKTWQLFLQDETVKGEMNHLENRYSSKLKFYQLDMRLQIWCTSDIHEKAVHEHESLRKRKTEYCNEVTKRVESTHLKAGMCNNLLQNEIQTIEEKFHVKFKPVSRNDKTGWVIKGPNGTLEKACMYFIQKILENLIESPVQISKTNRELFNTDEGQNILKQVAKQHKCYVVKEIPATISSESSDEPGQELRPCMNGRRWTFENKKVAGLYCGDISQSECEAHVFAKPKSNIMTGTETKRIEDDYHCYKDQGSKIALDVLVAPQTKTEQQLPIFELVFNELCKNNISSVAISLDDCESIQWSETRFMLTALLQFKACKGPLATCLFIHSQKDKYEFVKKCVSAYITAFYIPVTKAEDYEILDQQNISSQRGDKTKDKAKVILIKGDLHAVAREEKCDVVVNTTNENLKLNEGAVSNSILKVAGPMIQEECYRTYSSGVKFGHYAITKGYNLGCQYVFHGVFPYHFNDKEHKMLKDIMSKCLQEVDRLKLSSIAFPAIGTGILKYPKDQVAAEMYEAVKKYISSDVPLKTIQRIYFVVYGLDTETYKAFEREQAEFERSFKDMPPNSQPVEKSRPMNALYMKYGKTDLHVTQGDVAHRKADCLVIFWTDNEIYTNPIKKKYFLKAGETVVTEWRSGIQNLRKEKVIFTKAGDLNYKWILHLMTSDTKLFEDVQTLFKLVKEKSLTSVVIPFQSTDEITKLRDKFVVAIDTGLKMYDKEKTLESVEIVINNEILYKTFKEKMAKQNTDAVIADFDDRGAVGGVVEGAVKGAVGGAVEGAVGGAVEGAVKGAVKGAVGGAVEGAVKGAVGGAVEGAVEGADQASPHQIEMQLVSVCHNKDISEPRITIVGFNSDVEEALQKLNQNIANLNKKKTMAPNPLQLTEEDITESSSQSKASTSQCNMDVKNPRQKIIEKRDTEHIKEKDIVKKLDKKERGLEGTLKEHEEVMRPQMDTDMKETCKSENTDREEMEEKDKEKNATGGVNVNTENQNSDTEDEWAVISKKDATETSNAAPGTRTPLYKSEYEKRRLIFKPKDEKKSLKKIDVEQTLKHWNKDWGSFIDMVVCPFGENEALLIWKSSVDASKFAKIFSNVKYQLCEFPAQAVVNVKATINFKVIQKAQQQNCMDEFKNVYEHSGAHLVDNGDKTWLEGSLIEIHLGCKFLAEVVQSKSLMKGDRTVSPEHEKDGKTLNKSAEQLNPNSVPAESSSKGKLTFTKMEYNEVKFFEPDCIDNILEVWNEKKSEVNISGDLAPLVQAKTRIDKYETSEVHDCTADELERIKHLSKDLEKNKVWCYIDPQKKLTMRCKDGITLETFKTKVLHVLDRQRVTSPKDHKFADVPSATSDATGQQKNMPVARKEIDDHSNSLKLPKGSEVKTFKHNISVRVHVGDILKLDVECIVNAANANLHLDSGISKVIAESAGPQLQEACSNLMKERKSLKTGESVATKAGSLPFKCVIHTMGPFWTRNCSGPFFRDNVATAIETCLRLADDRGMVSIGIPAISAGASDVPFDLCAEGYVLGIEKFVNAVTSTNLKEIHFVLLDGGSAFVVRQIFSKEHDKDEVMPSISSVQEGSLYPLKDNMLLFVCTGDILEMDCEIIVNFENEEFQNMHPITKQLQEKAGENYTAEYARNKPATQETEVTYFETGGGLLSRVKTILHFILPRNTLQKNSEEALPSVLECYKRTLKRADALNVVSVAVPFFYVDTYTKQEVNNTAVCLVRYIMEFCSTLKPDSKLRRINIVSDKSNKELIKQLVESYFGKGKEVLESCV